MFLKKTIYSVFVLTLSLFFLSCKKAPNYAKEPVIEFDNLKVKSDLAERVDSVSITIKFKDGDGDLGNDPVNTSYLDYFVEIYKRTNGLYTRIGFFDTIPFFNAYNAYLPLLSPYKLTGPIDGSITRILPNFPVPVPGQPGPFQIKDTLQFQVRIRDRAGNYSNWVETSDYIIWKDF